jgi:hypothetical protein
MGGHDDRAYAPEVEEEPDALDDERTPLAVCLVSGGMDSCVTAAIASEENDELAFLHADRRLVPDGQ